VPSGRGCVDLTGKSRVRASGDLDQGRQLVIGGHLGLALAATPGQAAASEILSDWLGRAVQVADLGRPRNSPRSRLAQAVAIGPGCFSL